jgi:hypothetical protein
MEFTTLGPGHFPLLGPFFRGQPHRLSVFSLAGIVCWRNEGGSPIRFAIEDGTLLLTARCPDRPEQNHLSLPLPWRGQEPEELARLATRLGCSCFAYVPGEVFDAWDPAATERLFTAERRPDFDDYVYAASDLADLPGRPFAKKRNLVKQFEREWVAAGRVRVGPLSGGDAGDCLRFLEDWHRSRVERDGANPGLDDELAAARNALVDLERLELSGLVLRLDGRVAGLGIAAPLTGEMGVLHVEKAEAGVTGLYQYLDREIARRLFLGRFRWINKESDLGHPELRKAKLSGNPVEMVRCFRLRLR